MRTEAAVIFVVALRNFSSVYGVGRLAETFLGCRVLHKGNLSMGISMGKQQRGG